MAMSCPGENGIIDIGAVPEVKPDGPPSMVVTTRRSEREHAGFDIADTEGDDMSDEVLLLSYDTADRVGDVLLDLALLLLLGIVDRVGKVTSTLSKTAMWRGSPRRSKSKPAGLPLFVGCNIYLAIRLCTTVCTCYCSVRLACA